MNKTEVLKNCMKVICSGMSIYRKFECNGKNKKESISSKRVALRDGWLLWMREAWGEDGWEELPYEKLITMDDYANREYCRRMWVNKEGPLFYEFMKMNTGDVGQELW